MLVASRYRSQRYLVNPTIFAIYWMVLRLILAVVFLAMAISAVAVAATGQGLRQAVGIILRYPIAALSVFAWVTTIFVILDIVLDADVADVSRGWCPQVNGLVVLRQLQRRVLQTSVFALGMITIVFGLLAQFQLQLGSTGGLTFSVFPSAADTISSGPSWL